MLKVLLVDDDAIVLKGLKKVIPWAKLNSEIIGEARNGQMALQKIAENKPDLIISDIKMPVMDGLELSKELNMNMPGISIILLSAYEDFSYAKTAMKYGVKDYIIKPVDYQKVSQIIEKVREISLKLEKRNNLYSEFDGSTVEDQLLEAVRSGDEEFIISLVEDRFSQFIDEVSLIKELSFKLAGIIFRIIGKLNLGMEFFDIKKEDIISQLFALNTTLEMKKFTLDIYLRLIRFINKKKVSKADSLVDEILFYICNNFSNPDLTVSCIADKFNISANYLSMLFRQTEGLNVSAYITQLRINKAKELLRKQNINISSVCRMSGYGDIHYFSKVFKKVEGMTPSKYRNLSFNPVQEFIEK